MQHTQKPQSIQELHDALHADLAACHTDLERSMCKAIGGREIRLKAYACEEFRKLTPTEISIARQYGYQE